MLKNYPFKTNSPVYYINSTFIVFTIVSQQLVQIVFTGFLFGDYKGLPSLNNIFTRISFFSNSNYSNFIFITHFFRGLAGAYVNPRRFSLFVHSLVCPVTHSSLDGFQPNLIEHFLYLSYCFQPKEHI